MGIFCSCFHVPDVENDAGSNNASSNTCSCPKCFFRRLMTKHSNAQQTSAPSNPQLIPHDHSDANRPNDGARGRQEKGARVQLDPVGQSGIQLSLKSIEGNTIIIPIERKSESSKVLSSLDDEDVCPTCFDDYTEENPKIVAKCSHHYHLSCIYEWMERSQNCPTCGKLMLFDESS